MVKVNSAKDMYEETLKIYQLILQYFQLQFLIGKWKILTKKNKKRKFKFKFETKYRYTK